MGIDILDGFYVFHFNPISGNWVIKKPHDFSGALKYRHGEDRR